MNFRLNSRTVARLSTLSKELHLSKTDVLEKAIDFYAKKQMRSQSDLMKFAGILSEEDANKMQSAIRESRHNKDEDVEL